MCPSKQDKAVTYRGDTPAQNLARFFSVELNGRLGAVSLQARRCFACVLGHRLRAPPVAQTHYILQLPLSLRRLETQGIYKREATVRCRSLSNSCGRLP